MVKADKPFNECHWIKEGIFLAGEYPRNLDEDSSQVKINQILNSGIKSFVDLTEEGELILETLIIEEKHGQILKPKERYAQMRNVWNIPSLSTLQKWLSQSGFTNYQLIDKSVTTADEQRATEWMTFQSLNDFLDPNDSSKTVEGYPAPIRALVRANKASS